MRFLSTFTFLLFLNSTFAQEKLTSAENIRLLKQGALFVRLKTSDLKIKALTEKGMQKEADEMRTNQEMENKAIAEAFKKNYSFSKVYFFYSNFSTEVREGKYRKYLMNTDLQADSSFTGNYLVGEFDKSNSTQLEAFIIKNKNYEQLYRPFPFLIKVNKMLVSTKTKEQIVIELNTRLFAFWKKE